MFDQLGVEVPITSNSLPFLAWLASLFWPLFCSGSLYLKPSTKTTKPSNDDTSLIPRKELIAE
jgi:hypothetical protein